MSAVKEQLGIEAGPQTEDLANFIFQNLSDEEVDETGLERISPVGDVARELITTAAVITCSSLLFIRILKLVERWMEENRQRRSIELVYAAAKENPLAVKALTDLEKKHADVLVKYGSGQLDSLIAKGITAVKWGA